jgi:1,4-alpha-glucan branching enzyme
MQMKTSTPLGTKRTVKQKFSLKAPDAKSVLLAADFTDWQQRPLALKPQAEGVWSVWVTLPPGTYHYRFIVDGQWRDDPDCPQCVPNPYGGHNMVRVVPLAPRPPARAATLRIKRPHGRTRRWEPTEGVRRESSGSRIITL